MKNAVKSTQSLVWSLAAGRCYWGCVCMEGNWISACLCWRKTWRVWKVLWPCLSKEKYRFSCPPDLSCGFTSVDFVIFFGGFLEFRRFYCRVFGFTIRRHQTYFSLACLPVFLQLIQWLHCCCTGCFSTHLLFTKHFCFFLLQSCWQVLW